MRKLTVVAAMFFVAGPAWAAYPTREAPALGIATTGSPDFDRQPQDKQDRLRVAPKCPGGCKTQPKKQKAFDTDTIRQTLGKEGWINVAGRECKSSCNQPKGGRQTTSSQRKG